MNRALFAVLLALPAQALAEPPRLTGSWRVEQVTTASGTMSFPAALAQEGKDLVWGRWLWTFGDKELTVTSQVLQLNSETAIEKGKRTLQESDYTWCSASVTVDVGWAGPQLMLPSMVQAEHRSGRYDKRDAEVYVEACNIRLNGVQSLHLLDGGASNPKTGVTLVSLDESFKITLVPDKAAVSVKALIE